MRLKKIFTVLMALVLSITAVSQKHKLTDKGNQAFAQLDKFKQTTEIIYNQKNK